jgi:hypothetical protein
MLREGKEFRLTPGTLNWGTNWGAGQSFWRFVLYPYSMQSAGSDLSFDVMKKPQDENLDPFLLSLSKSLILCTLVRAGHQPQGTLDPASVSGL